MERELRTHSVKALRTILGERGVDLSDCIEKEDLIRRVLATTPASESGIELPPEQWLSVMSHLDVRSLCRAQRACRSWYELASLSSLWKPLVINMFTPLIKSKVEDGDYKRAFEKALKYRINGEWIFRLRSIPFVNVEVQTTHNPIYKGPYFLIHDPANNGGPIAFGIHVAQFAAVMFLVPRVGVLSLSVREITDDCQTMSGPFNDIFFGRAECPTGFAYCRRELRSITEAEFSVAENEHKHTVESSLPIMGNSWNCTLTFDDERVADAIDLVPAPSGMPGHYFGHAAEYVKSGAINFTVSSVVHKNGAIGIFRGSLEWPPSRFWVALCWMNEDSTLGGFVAEVRSGFGIRSGKFSASIVAEEVGSPAKRARRE